MSKQTLSMTAALDNLGDLRRFVRQAATAMGASAESVASLVLATDEVATNVMVHGYRGREGPIDIEIERQGDEIVVRVRDQAPVFDSTGVPAPDLTIPLEERPLGGLGVYLARRVLDDMIHRVSAQGGNELTLVKRIDACCS